MPCDRTCAIRRSDRSVLTGFDVLCIEIRAADGGDDAALFAADMVRMYMRYARRIGHTVEILEWHAGRRGGVKTAVLQVSGPNLLAAWQAEAGVHRVQRVPPTEKNGRRHTSAVTVAVVPAPQEDDLFDPKDVRFETMRASGPGGQHVNKTESAVRAIHVPTGITVVCQSERSQKQNKARALAILHHRVRTAALSQAARERQSKVRSQIGTGSRSEHTRTYNFISGFVTDHRTGRQTSRIKDVMDGRLDLIR